MVSTDMEGHGACSFSVLFYVLCSVVSCGGKSKGNIDVFHEEKRLVQWRAESELDSHKGPANYGGVV